MMILKVYVKEHSYWIPRTTRTSGSDRFRIRKMCFWYCYSYYWYHVLKIHSLLIQVIINLPLFGHLECKLNGLDFRGHDYRQLTNIPSVDMCQSVCASDPQCQYWTWKAKGDRLHW